MFYYDFFALFINFVRYGVSIYIRETKPVSVFICLNLLFFIAKKSHVVHYICNCFTGTVHPRKRYISTEILMSYSRKTFTRFTKESVCNV